MPELKPNHVIASILGGHAPTLYFGGEGQFLSSIGIDPDQPLPGSSFSNKQAGIITPTRYTEFSASLVDDAPMWLITEPRASTSLIYAYLSDSKSATNSGALISYTDAFGSETDEGTPTSGSGDGAAYYNNYIYLATPTDVSRFGPLSGSDDIRNTAWTANTPLTSTGGGLQLTALTDTAYPSYQSVPYPSHAMHVHSDGVLYFCDVNSERQGIINKINTIASSGVEGVIDSTANPSAYNALDLPFGYLPMDIASYGTDLAIIANQTTDGTLDQGKAAMFLWDTVADSYYMSIPIPDPFATAIVNHNGRLKIFTGKGADIRGTTVLEYLGGYTFEPLSFHENSLPPYAGAVDTYGSRLSWGATFSSDPVTAAGVLALGYKDPNLPRNARHGIARISGSGSSPLVSSIKYAQQASGAVPRVIMGWQDGSAQGIDSLGGSYNAVMRSEVFVENRKFKITRIRIRLTEAVGANTAIAVVIHYDRGGTTKTLNAINNTNFTGSEQIINYKKQAIEDATTAGYEGLYDFFLEFTMTGSDGNSILLPVEIWTETILD